MSIWGAVHNLKCRWYPFLLPTTKKAWGLCAETCFELDKSVQAPMNSTLSNNTRLKWVVIHHSLLSTSVGFATTTQHSTANGVGARSINLYMVSNVLSGVEAPIFMTSLQPPVIRLEFTMQLSVPSDCEWVLCLRYIGVRMLTTSYHRSVNVLSCRHSLLWL